MPTPPSQRLASSVAAVAVTVLLGGAALLGLESCAQTTPSRPIQQAEPRPAQEPITEPAPEPKPEPTPEPKPEPTPEPVGRPPELAPPVT